nr:hypothetical protein [Tanacetum cinerariifolium]
TLFEAKYYAHEGFKALNTPPTNIFRDDRYGSLFQQSRNVEIKGQSSDVAYVDCESYNCFSTRSELKSLDPFLMLDKLSGALSFEVILEANNWCAWFLK